MNKIEIRVRVEQSEVVFSLRSEEVRKLSAEALCKKWIVPSLAGMMEAALADYHE